MRVSIVIQRPNVLDGSQAAIHLPSGDQTGGHHVCRQELRADEAALRERHGCSARDRHRHQMTVRERASFRSRVALPKTSCVPSGENATGSSDTFFATGSSRNALPSTFMSAILSVA